MWVPKSNQSVSFFCSHFPQIGSLQIKEKTEENGKLKWLLVAKVIPHMNK